MYRKAKVVEAGMSVQEVKVHVRRLQNAKYLKMAANGEKRIAERADGCVPLHPVNPMNEALGNASSEALGTKDNRIVRLV